MKQKEPIFQTIRRVTGRAKGAGLPTREEIETFGADGEEAVCRLLRADFDCVIRNAVIPHKKKYLEKDFLVIYKGAPFVIEVKCWKGTVRADGDVFYQDKANGVRKTQKSPVGTTKQFIDCMKSYYELERPIYGIVAFAEPDCVLELPEEMNGIALLRAEKIAAYIKACVKKEEKGLEAVYKLQSYTGNERFTDSIDGVQFSVNAGLGVEYKLANPAGIYFEPNMVYFFNSDVPRSMRTDQPLQVKGELGLRFHF